MPVKKGCGLVFSRSHLAQEQDRLKCSGIRFQSLSGRTDQTGYIILKKAAQKNRILNGVEDSNDRKTAVIIFSKLDGTKDIVDRYLDPHDRDIYMLFDQSCSSAAGNNDIKIIQIIGLYDLKPFLKGSNTDGQFKIKTNLFTENLYKPK